MYLFICFLILYYFLKIEKNEFFFFIFTLISLTTQKKINPIPEGNGKLNENYNHQNEDNLFFIFLNSRHGARTPLFLLDDHEDMLGGKWVGKGMLTKLGKRQHYELGLKIRKKYPNFLNNEYDPREVLFYSTNYSRAILSAESLLLGLYNNISYQNFNFTDINNNDNEIMNLIIGLVQ